jgi:hypothetical protein
MRLLLDESLPRLLKAEYGSHGVSTVPELGGAGKDNGELLRLASGNFDVFITAALRRLENPLLLDRG